MQKQWIRLFCVHDRSDLEQSLNQFISEHDVTEIKVWSVDSDEYHWNAQVRYSFSEAPKYDYNEE